MKEEHQGSWVWLLSGLLYSTGHFLLLCLAPHPPCSAGSCGLWGVWFPSLSVKRTQISHSNGDVNTEDVHIWTQSISPEHGDTFHHVLGVQRGDVNS